ncbi:MAG: response regulator transcription factor [Phocaeicola sp.]|nr:response regulator transcription factor [Phocaeicola sp.]
MKVLVIEDDRDLCEIAVRSLEKERYVVAWASDYYEAMQKLEDYEYDCILLDIMLPGGNGLDLLKYLRELKKDTAVIILSAKDSLEDKIAGLDLGADDYLPKPYHLAELHARIKSVVRRHQRNSIQTVSYGNVEINPDRFEVQIAGSPVSLNRKEYDILYYFLTRPNRLVNKETLAEAVWGDHIDQVDNFDFMYAQVKNLRRHLKQYGASVELKAVYGFGYKLSEL